MRYTTERKNQTVIMPVNMIKNFPKLTAPRVKTPFFGIMDDDRIAARFIDAVANDSPDAALPFLSKRLNAQSTIDLDKLREILCGYDEYKCLGNPLPESLGHNVKKNSILIISNDYGRNDVLHLYMVKEPDCYGNWKICGVEREN